MTNILKNSDSKSILRSSLIVSAVALGLASTVAWIGGANAALQSPSIHPSFENIAKETNTSVYGDRNLEFAQQTREQKAEERKKRKKKKRERRKRRGSFF